MGIQIKLRLFCMKLKISITIELIEFSSLGKLHLDHRMILGKAILFVYQSHGLVLDYFYNESTLFLRMLGFFILSQKRFDNIVIYFFILRQICSFKRKL